MNYASCEADWALPGAGVGREEALVDAMALRRLAICGNRILERAELTAAKGLCRRCLRTILQSRVLKLVATRGHAVGAASVEGAGRKLAVKRPGREVMPRRLSCANVKPPSEANFQRGLYVSRPWPGLFCLPSCSGQPAQDFLQGLQGTCRDVPSGREPRYRR